MLKAKKDNTLCSNRRRVFVDGNEIKIKNTVKTRTWRTFPSPEKALCAMSHVWSLAVARGGLSLGQVASEIDGWR